MENASFSIGRHTSPKGSCSIAMLVCQMVANRILPVVQSIYQIAFWQTNSDPKGHGGCVLTKHSGPKNLEANN